MALRLRTTAAVLGTGTEAAPSPADHVDLVDRLVEQAGDEVRDGDLVMLSFAAPDSRPHMTVVTHLNRITGGGAHSIAVTGQGLGSPFTALRIANSYARVGRTAKTVLAIVESATADGSDQPERVKSDTGVLLSFETAAGRQRLDTVFTARPDELAGVLSGLVPEQGRLLIVLGPAVEPEPALGERVDVHRATAGSYCTSVWLSLAHNHSRWESEYAVIALCDVDPRSGTGHLAVLRTGA